MKMFMPHETECPTIHRFTLAELLPDPNNPREEPTAVPSEGPGPGPTEEKRHSGITRLPSPPVTEAATRAARTSGEPTVAEDPLPSYWE